jgi:DnaJ-class molecular chaperone
MVKKHHPDITGDNSQIENINRAFEILKGYVKNYKFSFSEDEITKQYPQEFLKKFKV